MALSRYRRTRGFRDGVLSGRRGWLAVGVLVWTGRLVKKLLSRPAQLVAVERLEPGQSLTVSALDPENGVTRTSRGTRRRS
ncbi:MAG: hypothetical protein ACKOA6_03275 [Actinomycetota bacterium]